jgi:hypothetical protein
MLPVPDLQELDVGLAREIGVRFEVRAVLMSQLRGNFRQRDHAVRIADGGRAEGEIAVEDADLFIEDLARGAGQVDGNFALSKLTLPIATVISRPESLISDNT